MLQTISLMAILFTGCGDSTEQPPPADPAAEAAKAKAEAEAKAAEEAAKAKAAEEAKTAEKEAMKEEIKEEMKAEDAAKAAEEAAKAPKAKAKPKSKMYKVRVNVKTKPLKTRRDRLNAKAKEMLAQKAGKDGYPSMEGSITFSPKTCKGQKGDNCVLQASATFKK